MNKTITRQVFRWHSRLGLVSSLFVFVFFITGAIVVFNLELEKAQHPELLNVQPGSTLLTYDSIYRAVQVQRSDLYLYSFRRLPIRPDEAIEMRVYDPSDQSYPLLFVNPYTGRVNGLLKQSIYGFFISLHYTFYLGRIGELLAGIFAFALLGSIITGIFVYRKHILDVLLFRIFFRTKNWKTLSSSLHRIVGVWALVFHFILAFSGAYMMLYAFDLKAQFGNYNNGNPTSPPPLVTINLDDIIQATKEQLPEFKFTYMDFPRTTGSTIQVQGDLPGRWWLGTTATSAAYDYIDRKLVLLQREDQLGYWQQFEYGLYTFHYGQFGGLAIKLLYFIIGMAGVLLTVTGWLLRKRKTYK